MQELQNQIKISLTRSTDLHTYTVVINGKYPIDPDQIPEILDAYLETAGDEWSIQ